MEYDSLFKQLLKTFFQSFMELFFPEETQHIQWESIEFLDTEEHAQTDEGQSFHRSADLIVKVYAIDGEEELVLIHVEIENPWRENFRARMFEYFMFIRLRYSLPIFPIAICPERRSKPFEMESYTEKIFGHKLLSYNYFHLGLPGLSVADYWTDDNPVSWAFSSLMNRGDEDKIHRLETCYHRIYESGLPDNQKSLLVNFTRTYYQLTPEEATVLRERLNQASNKEIEEMEYSYFGQARQEGRQEGMQEGKQEGMQEGRQEGMQAGMHFILLEMLQVKFGELPQVTTDRVRAIESQEELASLVTKAHNAESLEDLGLNGTA